jgi:predicted porin
MALRHGIITAAFVLAVLGTGQALADDSVTPATSGNNEFVFGNTGQAPADESAGDDGSLWMDLRSLFSDTTVSIGTTPADNGHSFDTEPGYNAYANVNIGGFTVGGRFARWGETAFSDADKQAVGVGASYSLRSWTVGIDWSRGNYDEVFLDAGSGSGDVIAFTSSYALRPGVKINGLLEYSEDQPVQERSTAGALTVGIGTLINF